MKPKKLKQEQIDMIKRSNERHNLFTFDLSHPFYYVIDHVFSDPKKHMLVYFDEENSLLVWMEELQGEKLNTPVVQKWIEEYHKKRKKDEQEKEKAKAKKKAEREKEKEAKKKEVVERDTTYSNKKKPGPKPKAEKKKPGPKSKVEKKDGTPKKKPGPKPKNKKTESKDDKENEKVA